MKWYLFAKFFQSLTPDALMEYCAREGLDGPTALVREGYWTPPEALKETLPGFIQCARKHGLEVKYADTPIDFADAKATEESYAVLADAGIEKLRLAHIVRGDRDPRTLSDLGRRYAETACEMGRKYGVQSILQIHGRCYPLNATSAWPLVKDLDPRYVGIKLDPGNNYCQEGYEQFPYQIGLLKEYIAALGAKDACALRTGEEGDQKGWKTYMVPAYAGQTDYVEVFRLLYAVGFDGPAILMPFYEEFNLPALQRALTREIAYFKKCAAKAREV